MDPRRDDHVVDDAQQHNNNHNLPALGLLRVAVSTVGERAVSAPNITTGPGPAISSIDISTADQGTNNHAVRSSQTHTAFSSSTGASSLVISEADDGVNDNDDQHSSSNINNNPSSKENRRAASSRSSRARYSVTTTADHTDRDSISNRHGGRTARRPSITVQMHGDDPDAPSDSRTEEVVLLDEQTSLLDLGDNNGNNDNNNNNNDDTNTLKKSRPPPVRRSNSVASKGILKTDQSKDGDKKTRESLSSIGGGVVRRVSISRFKDVEGRTASIKRKHPVDSTAKHPTSRLANCSTNNYDDVDEDARSIAAEQQPAPRIDVSEQAQPRGGGGQQQPAIKPVVKKKGFLFMKRDTKHADDGDDDEDDEARPIKPKDEGDADDDEDEDPAHANDGPGGGGGVQGANPASQGLMMVKSGSSASSDRNNFEAAGPRQLQSGRNSSSSIGLSKFPHARELMESFGVKVKEVTIVIVSVLLNLLVIFATWYFSRGITVKFSKAVMQYGGAVTVHIFLLITNIVTIEAVDIGISIVLASRLTSKRGYSMAACGFMHKKPGLRHEFTQNLSLNSKCRKFLNRVSYAFLALEALVLLSPIGATGVVAYDVRVESSKTNCILFDDLILRDRQVPTLEHSIGASEFLYGKALGCMRSELDCGDASMFVFGPQLDGIVGSGDNIFGDGITGKIATTCECRNVSDPYVIKAGLLTAVDQSLVTATISSTEVPFLMLGNTITMTADTVTMTTVLGKVNICGGMSPLVAPICTTTFGEFTTAKVESAFLTDGTTASIALVESILLETDPINTLNISSIALATTSILPPTKIYELPSTIPGMLNPLLYWCSGDLLAIDPSLLAPGIETTHSVILRSGIQRTFRTRGDLCTRRATAAQSSIISLMPWGTISFYVCGIVQLVMSLFALLMAGLWITATDPLIPAMRALRDPTYFMTLLCDSTFVGNLAFTSNAPDYAIWQSLDTPVVIGETIETMEEPVGHIKIDRSKFVRPFRNGRIYY